MWRERPRDSQRSKVYLWEGTNLNVLKDYRLDRRGATDLTKRLLAAKGLNAKVTFRKKSACNAYVSRGQINYSYGSSWHPLTAKCVAHEAAHIAAGYGVEGHGPEFMRAYLEHASVIAQVDAAELAYNARRAGIRVAYNKEWFR